MRKKAIFILAGMAAAFILALPGCPSPMSGGGEPTAGGADSAFHAPVLDSLVKEIALLSNGQILIAGGFSKVNGTERKGIARLNADGSLDASFQSPSGACTHCFFGDIAIKSDGNILVCGDDPNANFLKRILN